MTAWKSRADLQEMADEAGRAMIRLYEKQGNELTDTSVVNLCVDVLANEAESAAAIDLLECEWEHERLQQVAKSFDPLSAENDRAFDAINTELEKWGGIAAEAFKNQKSRIVEFLRDHRENALHAMKAPVTLYTLGVYFREAVYGLHQAIVSLCEAAIEDIDKEAIGVILDLVTEGLKTLIAKPSPAELLQKGIGMVVDAGAGVAKDGKAGGSHFDEIWNNAHNENWRKIADSFEFGLGLLARELDQHRERMANESPKLYEPLPANTNVTGPNFDYDHFSNPKEVPGSGFEERLEEERGKYEPEAPGGNLVNPNSPIQRRLDGNGD